MNQEQLFIPTKCKVGSQLREGTTYTGKLGYIIYNDGKVWRKEPSWESWRHKEGQKLHMRIGVGNDYTWGDVIITGVEPIEFDNVPTSGFVLNKKAGGTSSGWNHRQTYCRVYDPRGWEFEITIPNLLFVLEESTSIKGKGLEGEFVYSWDGKDLVLLPVSSNDYKVCMSYTELQSKQVSARDLVPGCSYLTNKQVELIYIGRYPYFDSYYNRAKGEDDYGKRPVKKNHIFLHVRDDESTYYENLSTITTIKEKISDEIDPKFSFYLDDFLKSIYASPAKEVVIRDFNDDDISGIQKSHYSTIIYSKETNQPYQLHRKEPAGFKVVIENPNYSGWGTRNNERYNIVHDDVNIPFLKLKYGKKVRVYENGALKDI